MGAVTPPVFALSCFTQSLKDNRAYRVAPRHRHLGGDASAVWCQVKKKKRGILHRILHSEVSEWVCSVCICDCDWFVCKVGQGCYFLPSGRHESSEISMPLISPHKRTKLSPPYHGRKTPTTKQKKPALSSWLHLLKSPKEGKVSREREKNNTKKKKKPHSLPPILPGARGSPGSAWVSPTTELCLDRNQCSSHRIGIQ